MNFFSKSIQNQEEIQIPLLVLTNYFQHIPYRYRLILIKNGSGIIEINVNRFRVISPCLICLSDKDEGIEFLPDGNFQTVEMVFHPALLHDNYENEDPERLLIQAFISRSHLYTGIIQLDALSAHRLEGLMSSLSDRLLETENEYWICRSRSLLLESLILTDRLYLKQLQDKRDGFLDNPLPDAAPLVNDLLCYLQTHYEESITIETLCQQFHVNRTTLNQSFKKEMNIPIMQYLIELRIEVTKVLLVGTRLQVNEIMGRVGYTDLAHFNRAFKSKVGETPSKFREKYTSNA